jgi:hypothetical protein
MNKYQNRMDMIYRNVHTREISFPLGGIGAGCIGLAGNGRLIDWEIFNRPAKGSFNGMSHFAVRAEQNGRVIDARILHGDLQPPYTGTCSQVLFDGFGWGPSRNNLSACRISEKIHWVNSLGLKSCLPMVRFGGRQIKRMESADSGTDRFQPSGLF